MSDIGVSHWISEKFSGSSTKKDRAAEVKALVVLAAKKRVSGVTAVSG
jgi:hypothetical protein